MSHVAIHSLPGATFNVSSTSVLKNSGLIRRREDPIFKSVLASSARAFAGAVENAEDWEQAVLQETGWEDSTER